MFEKNWDFAKILRTLREKRRLTQAELGQRAGIAPAAISHFETGLRRPSPENLKKLAQALSVSVDYLLGAKDTPAPTGPRIRAIFRHAQEMSADALEQLEDLSKLLADRDRRKRSKDDPKA